MRTLAFTTLARFDLASRRAGDYPPHTPAVARWKDADIEWLERRLCGNCRVGSPWIWLVSVIIGAATLLLAAAQ
jgi:hypothetical protein